MEGNNGVASSSAGHAARKLEILCLHGFRQNSKQFKGRLAGLQKKIAHVANLTFIDAPYVLPFWYKQPQQHQDLSEQQPQQGNTHSHPSCCPAPSPKRAWLLSPDLLVAQPELQSQYAQQEAVQKERSQLQDAPSMPPICTPDSVAGSQARSNLPQAAVTQATIPGQMPQEHESQASCQSQVAPGPALWQPAPDDVTTMDQYTTQCCGWDRSWSVIWDALNSGKQYDGILGFSQGAAVAAVVAALLEQHKLDNSQLNRTPYSQPQLRPGHASGQPTSIASPCTDQGFGTQLLQECQQPEPSSDHQQSGLPQSAQGSKEPAIKFVILASGFVSPTQEHQELLALHKPIPLPSLHVYAGGSSSSDRQIQQQLSEDLSKQFEPASRQILVHSAGHLIPCNRGVVDRIVSFLQRFAQ